MILRSSNKIIKNNWKLKFNSHLKNLSSSTSTLNAKGNNDLNTKVLSLTKKYLNERNSLIDNSSNVDVKTLSSKSRRLNQLENLFNLFNDYDHSVNILHSTKSLADDETDPLLKQMAQSEIDVCELNVKQSFDALYNGLLSSHFPNQLSPKGILLELKSGVGGSESGLFVQDMLKMYKSYAQFQNWSTHLVSTVLANESAGGNGALKEALMEIKGKDVWDSLRFEKGVHRVQRVPATETQGRTHTSTIGVLVMPLADNNTGDRKLYDDKDVKVEVMRARGAGGQHVNKTESAVRLTHLPTGIQVSMQDTRSQQQNRTKAYQVLSSRLLEKQLQAETDARKASRKSQIKNMDRSDKIRTYNFPQDRITDHRVNFGISGIQSFFESGEGLDILIRELNDYEKELQLEQLLTSDDV